MSKRKTNFLFSFLNVWFGFIALLLLSSQLPHWNNTTFHLWFNEAIYFFLFLVCLTLAIKDEHNRDIFINLSVLFFFHAFSFVNTFIGDSFLFGNNTIAYYFIFYKKIVFAFFLNFAIIYIVFKYLFPKNKIRLNYILTFLVLLPVFITNFHPYIADYAYGLRLGDAANADLFKRILYTDGLSFLFIIVYGIILYKTDRILGSSIDWLMAAFFVFSATNLVEMYASATGFKEYSISSYVLMANLIFISVILFKKLLFQCTEFGTFYEDLIHQKLEVGNVKFQRYKGESNTLILQVIKIYIMQRKHYLFGLIFLTAMGFAYFRLPRFFTLNVLTIFICSVLLFWFFYSLSKKRAKKEYVIHS